MDDEDDDEELDALIEQELNNLTEQDLENDVNDITEDQSNDDDVLLDYDVSFSKYFALLTTSDVIAKQKVEDAQDMIEAAGKGIIYFKMYRSLGTRTVLVKT